MFKQQKHFKKQTQKKSYSVKDENNILVFVVNEENPIKDLKRTELSSIYLARNQYWAEGQQIIRLDFPEKSLERQSLYDNILRKGLYHINQYWIKAIERGYPIRTPIIIKSPKRLLNFVSRDISAICYVRLSDYKFFKKKKRLKIRAISIEGVKPSIEKAKSGEYFFTVSS